MRSVKTRRRSDDYTPEPFALGGAESSQGVVACNDLDQWTGMLVPSSDVAVSTACHREDAPEGGRRRRRG